MNNTLHLLHTNSLCGYCILSGRSICTAGRIETAADAATSDLISPAHIQRASAREAQLLMAKAVRQHCGDGPRGEVSTCRWLNSGDPFCSRHQGLCQPYRATASGEAPVGIL